MNPTSDLRPCPQCGKEIRAEATRCGHCFATVHPVSIRPREESSPTSAGQGTQPVASSLSPDNSALIHRYSDAYLAARAINGLGQTIKVAGVVVAGIIALAGLVAGSKLGASVGFTAVLLGIVIALPFYALGVIVAAQGQVLKANLDTAVNSSPLLSHDEIRHLQGV